MQSRVRRPPSRVLLHRSCGTAEMWCRSARGAAWAGVAVAASLVLLARGASGATTEDDEDRWGTLVAVAAVRGSTAKLPCRISSENPSEPVLLVLWYKNSSVTPVYSYDSRGLEGRPSGGGRPHQWGDEEAWGVEQRAWFDTSYSPAHLLVRDVRGRDEGNYTCKVHFRASPSWSQRVTLTVRDPPGFPRIQDESGRRLEGPIGPFEDGTTVRMMCLSSGEPPPGLVWGGSGAGRGQASGEERKGEVARTWLTVVASRAMADATITCSTTNASVSSGIMHTVSTTLKVNLAPLSVRLESPAPWVSAGQQTSFRCRVVGSSPPPVVQWWLGGRRLTANAPLNSVGGNVSLSTVRLTPQPGDHTVPLVCKAFSPNLPGSVLQDQVTLAVHFVPVATVSVRGGGSEAATVPEGGAVTFACHLEANPAVYNVTWFHNGRALRGWAWGVEVHNATLRLLNVTAAMRGLYTCVGSNPEGDGQSNALNLNVEFAPVCAEQQRRHYVVAPGGSITVACRVAAHPTPLTFSWALKNDSDSPPVRLHSVGREEGLTGHYTLRGVKQKRVEVLCWARNAAGTQAAPCRLAVYTQGRPGPVRNCSVDSHTASGFRVACDAGPPRGTNTRYSLLVYTQDARRVDGERGSNEVHGDSGGGDGGDGGGGEGGGVRGKAEHGQQAKGTPRHSLGTLVQNLTTSSPVFLVRGLRAGREFAMVVRAAADQGVSPPVVLTAFTLTDNAQTVIGLPAGRGDTGSGGVVSATPFSSSSSNGNRGEEDDRSSDISSTISEEDVWMATGEGELEEWASWLLGLVPPLVLVLGTSLTALLLLVLITVLLVMKLRERSRHRHQHKVNTSGETTPDDTPPAPPGSRQAEEEGSTSMVDGGSAVGEVPPAGGDEQVLLEDGNKMSGEREATSVAGVAGGGVPHPALGAPLLVMSSSGGGVATWVPGCSATLPRLEVRWLDRDSARAGFMPGLRSVDASLGTSTTSVYTGASQSGLGALAGATSLGQMSGVGSLGAISDFVGCVGPGVGAVATSITNLSDFAAAAGGGIGGGVSVIGVGDFSNVGGVNAISNVGVTGVSDGVRRHSTSTHQPLQVMPGTEGAALLAGPQLPPGTWNTRL